MSRSELIGFLEKKFPEIKRSEIIDFSYNLWHSFHHLKFIKTEKGNNHIFEYEAYGAKKLTITNRMYIIL